MNWRTWWSGWTSWWSGSRHYSTTTTEEPTTEEPTTSEPSTPPPGPSSEWPAKGESVASPFGPGRFSSPTDSRCVQAERIDIPAPSPVDVDCAAAGSPPDPPPDPVGTRAQVKIYERGPKKVFQPWGTPQDHGSEDWYFASGIWTDMPFGEKQLIRSFYSIYTYNTGRSPLWTGGVNPLMGYLMIEFLLGTRDGPKNRAPKGRLAHLPGNSAYIRVPGMWHSYAAPLNIESYRPFRASACFTNVIPGLPPFSQYGSPVAIGNPFITPGLTTGWSTAGSVLAGMTVELVFEEYTPP